MQLADGVSLSIGDPVVDLHLWNEHIPGISGDGATLAWAHVAFDHVRESLQMLAVAIQADARFAGVKAVRGRSVLTPRGGLRSLRKFTDRLHFELRDRSITPTLYRRLHDLGENILIWGLLRTFNPGGLRGAKLNRMRTEAWISRDALVRMYRVPTDAMQKV